MTALGGVNGTNCNATQYQQSLQSGDSRSPSITCLTHGESIGLVFAAEASFLSCICVTTMIIWIGFSLFAFDILQATGGILNIRWAHNGIVTTGPYCTAQGLVAQIGELGLLAIHTFVAAVLQADLKARRVALGLVCLAFVFITLWVAIGAGIHKNYETPTPDWCWISPQFPRERLAGETIWMWIALFASVILYVPLYFWAEGYWAIDDDYRFLWWNADKRVEYSQRRAALGMLLYPLAYSLVILPLTIARCVQFSHHNVPPAVTFVVVSIFYLSGAINVVLFLITRPQLLLFPRPRELDGQEEMELTQE
ncbi:hypothetical protein BGY98DRAFT_1156386 [Russula aff. rugulosa BPL654]|nr:hypothetical protein BGY98DRAFT_1156386 [Russula aff. rugulosa BPL654]